MKIPNCRIRKQVRIFFVVSEVLTAMVMKSSIFWDITPCSPLKINRSFEGKCRLHLQISRISDGRNEGAAVSKQNQYIP
jgi:hypothetical protein